jgi:serine O-acetyltransferase
MDPVNFQERLVRARNVPVVGRFIRMLVKLYGIDLPRSVDASTLRLPHGSVGLVVHESTTLGRDVKVFQGVTLGRSDQYLSRDRLRSGGGIVIGDDVVIGAGAVVLFRSGETVTIGERAVIGANAVVTADVPPGEIWAGNPARKIRDRP